MVGVPQSSIWSPLMFSYEVLHCDLFQYADNSSLIRVILSKDDRTTEGDELNADLDSIYSWDKTWNINFEPAKCHTLLTQKDIDLYPPLFIAMHSLH